MITMNMMVTLVCVCVCNLKDINKFAELIIQECAKIADDGFGSAHFGSGIRGYMLKEHFGIKS